MATLPKSKAKIGIEYLAPEVLLMIATQLPDLLALDSLLRASPNTFRLFNSGNAVKITEAVLSGGSTHPHVRVIICVIALIRSSNLPIHNLDDFKSQVTLEVMENRTATSEHGFSPMLSPDTTPAILRSILASVRRITCLTLDCLKYYLHQFRSLNPQHLIDRTFQLRGYQPWEVHPQRREYPKQDVGPPSWTEEQRVFRAFWRIQIICDLKTAASHSLLRWPTKDLEQLDGEDLIQLFYDEFFLILLYQDDEPHPEFEEIRSVIHYAQAFQAEGFMGLLGQSQRSQEVQREWPSPVPSESDWLELDAASPSCDYYHLFVDPGRNFIGCGLSPLCNISFDPFTRRGFAFWDLQRMSAYGLLPTTLEPEDEFQLTFYLIAWHSILSADQVAEQERQNMAAFAGRRWA